MLSEFWDELGPTRLAQSATACQNSMQMITIKFSALWLGATCQAANRKPSSSRAWRRCPAETTCSPDTSSTDMIQLKPGYTCCTDRRSLTSLLHSLFMVYLCVFLCTCPWVQTQDALSISVYLAAHLFLTGLWGAFQFSLCLFLTLVLSQS